MPITTSWNPWRDLQIFFFCPNNSPKIKDIHFTILKKRKEKEKEKQQTPTFEKLVTTSLLNQLSELSMINLLLVCHMVDGQNNTLVKVIVILRSWSFVSPQFLSSLFLLQSLHLSSPLRFKIPSTKTQTQQGETGGWPWHHTQLRWGAPGVERETGGPGLHGGEMGVNREAGDTEMEGRI